MDTLHYWLDLRWDPEASRLDGVATIDLRATADAETMQLDLSGTLEVAGVTVDSETVEHRHAGKNLVIEQPVTEDSRHRVEVTYAGTPAPTPAPTTRSDFSDLGWHTTGAGEAWTMQEPFGAFTWYPVNDQPADKALYDVTIDAPGEMVGVSNGELTSRESVDGRTVTTWHLADPAAAYLVTIAIGDYELVEDEGPHGLPISYWVPADEPELVEYLDSAPESVAWLEERLGPFPYDQVGFVVVDSASAMETQTMITMGAGILPTRGESVVLHELTHQWYGDTVTPTDWSDLWMNEGMAMYLEINWADDEGTVPLAESVAAWEENDPGLRREAGPPGDYDPRRFGTGNVYYSAGLMWHRLRLRLGDERFWSMVRAWPGVDDNGSATREEYLAWIEEETGEELTTFFDTWLLSERSPA